MMRFITPVFILSAFVVGPQTIAHAQPYQVELCPKWVGGSVPANKECYTVDVPEADGSTVSFGGVPSNLIGWPPVCTTEMCTTSGEYPAFATFNGNAYTMDQTIELESGLNRVTIWFGHAAFIVGPVRTQVYAVDLVSDTAIQQPVVADLVPGVMSHPCFEGTPCNVEGCAKVTAYENVQTGYGERYFQRWLYGLSQDDFTVNRDVTLGVDDEETWSSIKVPFAVAFYRAGSLTPPTITSVCTPFEMKDCDWLSSTLISGRRPAIADLSRICLYMFGSEECPGCGPYGECGPWQISFQTSVPVELRLVDIKTKEKLAQTRPSKNPKLNLPGGPLDTYRIAIVPRPQGPHAPSNIEISGTLDVGPAGRPSKKKPRGR